MSLLFLSMFMKFLFEKYRGIIYSNQMKKKSVTQRNVCRYMIFIYMSHQSFKMECFYYVYRHCICLVTWLRWDISNLVKRQFGKSVNNSRICKTYNVIPLWHMSDMLTHLKKNWSTDIHMWRLECPILSKMTILLSFIMTMKP